MTMGWTSKPLEKHVAIFVLEYKYKSIILSKKSNLIFTEFKIVKLLIFVGILVPNPFLSWGEF